MPIPIIALSKDWNEDPTSNHHVLRELARTRRVLWLNSLATRTPSLTSTRDVEKIKRKVLEFRHGAKNVENDLWIATPLVLPFPHSATARIANRQLLRGFVRRLRAQLGIDRFQLWSFLPNAAPYIGYLGEELSVYYCVDEWATFSGLDADGTRAIEEQLLRKVDITFTTSLALTKRKREHCDETHFAPHGVDHTLFSRALDPDVAIPKDLLQLPAPRIGFYGTLRDFLDYELIAGIAKARPRWSIVMIGQQMADISPIANLPNVHLLGRRLHEELPAYCKGFDVGLVPYRVDDQVGYINPLKLREYLAAGVPVVTTAMPEVMPYARQCHVVRSVAEAVSAIEDALGEDRDLRVLRSAAMRSETWRARVAKIERTIDELIVRRWRDSLVTSAPARAS